MAHNDADAAPDVLKSAQNETQHSRSTVPDALARGTPEVADAFPNAKPQDRDSTRQQNRALRQALADRDSRVRELERAVSTRDHQMQQLEGQDRRLVSQARYPDNATDWLLDWALQQDRGSLLNYLLRVDARLPPISPLFGGGSTVLNLSAHTALSAEVIRKACFKFLDLPAELRNRIYDLAAKTAFSVPCMLAYKESTQGFDEYQDTNISTAMNNHFVRLDESRAYNRLAMLYVSHQIHEEARQIYYANMSLDLCLMYHPFGLPPMLTLISSPFKNKLQFVRHIEVEVDVAHCLLFGTFGYHYGSEIISNWRDALGTSKLSIQSLLRIRTLLFNLQSINVLAGEDHYLDFSDDAIGFEVIVNLIGLNDSAPNFLERLYPRLSDIVIEDRAASTRLRKTAPKQWELHYSHEPLPLTLRDDFATWFENAIDGKAWGLKKGLIQAGTLANIAGTN